MNTSYFLIEFQPDMLTFNTDAGKASLDLWSTRRKTNDISLLQGTLQKLLCYSDLPSQFVCTLLHNCREEGNKLLTFSLILVPFLLFLYNLCTVSQKIPKSCI